MLKKHVHITNRFLTSFEEFVILPISFMRKTIRLKYISWILIAVISAVTIHCVHESAHAMERHLAVGDKHASHAEMSVPHQCPSFPGEQHTDYDGCNTCINCVCHAPLTIQPLQLSYRPIISDLIKSDPFKHLPEVYLSKFIPPQKQA